jgi:polysaccharide biosynthesis protein PslG
MNFPWQTDRMRIRNLNLIAAAVAAALVIPLTTTAQAAPIKNPSKNLENTVIDDSLFGLHVKDEQLGVWPTIKFGSLRLWDNGTAWANIETSRGVFDWTNLDNAVATANKNGMSDILMVLSGTPAWATNQRNPLALPAPDASGVPANMADWDNWVRAVATRYKGQIKIYQPWNEANLTTFFTGTPAQMADMTKRAYDIVKSIDPSATIVAPSTGTRLGGPFKKFYPAFLNQLKARDWPVDVWAAHTYPASLGNTNDRQELANKWIDFLKAAKAPNLPLWDTENNYGLGGPGPENPEQDIEGVKAANWTAITYLDALRLGFSRVYMYQWGPYNDLWGIQYNDGAPGAQAMNTLQDWIVGTTYKNCKEKNRKVTCKFSTSTGINQIVYSETGRKTFKANKQYKQMCQLDGTCSPIPKNRKVRTAGPVLLKR